MRRRVLVTDGEERAALAVVRSLGRAGHDVRVCSPRRRSLAGASRYCGAESASPAPLAEPERFADWVRRACREQGIEVLVPISEASLLAVLPESQRPPGVCIPFPDVERFRALCDKRLVLEVAAEVGLAVPRQVVVTDPAEVEAAIDGLDAPTFVVKPSRSVGEAGGVRSKQNVSYARGADALRRAVGALPAAAFPVLVQQRVTGPGVGIFLLLRDGDPVALFSHRRLREKPPSGGVSVYRESIAPDPRLVEGALALLRRFEWWGVAMVEFKLDRATGRAYLMEVNGRFWGSLQLALDAGVDFPALLLDAVRGATGAPAAGYRTGVRSRWWWGDVDHLLARLRRSAEELDLDSGAPTRLAAVREFLALRRPEDRSEILRRDDPRPFVRETLDWVRRR